MSTSICNNCELPLRNGEGALTTCEEQLCSACKDLVNASRQISVSPLLRSDLELVLAWRSNPLIYEHFHEQSEPLEWPSHVSWFESRGAKRHDYVIHFEGRRVGVVSLAENGDVGIYLGDFAARGNGVASQALSWLCSRFSEDRELHAQIHEANNTSKNLFNSCGFERIDRDGTWELYEYYG